MTIAAVTGTKPHEAGLASGLINTSQQVGGALGLAILATVANSRTQSLLSHGVHNQSVALTRGFDRAFLVGAGFALVGAILTAILSPRVTAASRPRRRGVASSTRSLRECFRMARSCHRSLAARVVAGLANAESWLSEITAGGSIAR